MGKLRESKKNRGETLYNGYFQYKLNPKVFKNVYTKDTVCFGVLYI